MIGSDFAVDASCPVGDVDYYLSNSQDSMAEPINQLHHNESIVGQSISEPSSLSETFFNSEAADFSQHFDPSAELLGGHQYAENYDASHPFVASNVPGINSISANLHSSIMPSKKAVDGQPQTNSFDSSGVKQMTQHQCVNPGNAASVTPQQIRPVAQQGGYNVRPMNANQVQNVPMTHQMPNQMSNQMSNQMPNQMSHQMNSRQGNEQHQLSNETVPTVSEPEKEEPEPIPDCDVKRFVVAIGKTINKTEDQLYDILSLMIRKNWMETIEHLEGLSDDDWVQLDLPRQLTKILRQRLPEARSIIFANTPVTQSPLTNRGGRPPYGVATSGSMPQPGSDLLKSSMSQPCSNSVEIAQDQYRQGQIRGGGVVPRTAPGATTLTVSDESNEVEQLVRRVCVKHGRSQAELNSAIECLVEDNWFDSIDQLKALSQAQWDVLELPMGLATLLPSALQSDDLSYAVVEDTLETIIIDAGAAMGRTPSQLDATIRKLKQHGFQTASSLRTLSEADWTNFRLPLRLLEEIHKITDQSEPNSAFVSPNNSMVSPSSFNGSGNRFSAIPDPRIVTDKESREARVMSVDRFLLKMGLQVGRTEAEMEPVIHRIVKDNWLESLGALRSLKPEDWGALGLPRRLVDGLRRGLSDPYALELNTVQFTAPEADLFPCDTIAAVWKLEGEIPPNCLPDTLRSLLKLMETILCNPFDEAKRIIRKSNTNFQKRAGQYKSGLLVLQSIGYEDAGDCYLLPVAFITRITETHAALAQVAQLHRDRLSKSKKFSKLFSSIKKV